MENMKEKDIVERFFGLFLPFKDAGSNDLVIRGLDIVTFENLGNSLTDVIALAQKVTKVKNNSVSDGKCEKHGIAAYSGICITCLEDDIEDAKKNRKRAIKLIALCSSLGLPKQAKANAKEYLDYLPEIITLTLREAIAKCISRYIENRIIVRKDVSSIEQASSMKMETLENTEFLLPEKVLKFFEESNLLQCPGARQTLIVVETLGRPAFLGLPIQVGLWEGWCRLFVF